MHAAGYDALEAATDGQEFKDNQNEETRIQPTSMQSRNQSTIEKPVTKSADSNIASGQAEQSGIYSQPKTVTTSPTSGERQGVRSLVKAIAKRRAAAQQMGKAKQFDTYLALDKNAMQSETVNTTNFKLAAAA